MEVGVSHILPLSIKDLTQSSASKVWVQGVLILGLTMCSTSVIKQMLLRIEVFSEKMMFSVFLLAVC